MNWLVRYGWAVVLFLSPWLVAPEFDARLTTMALLGVLVFWIVWVANHAVEREVVSLPLLIFLAAALISVSFSPLRSAAVSTLTTIAAGVSLLQANIILKRHPRLQNQASWALALTGAAMAVFGALFTHWPGDKASVLASVYRVLCNISVWIADQMIGGKQAPVFHANRLEDSSQ